MGLCQSLPAPGAAAPARPSPRKGERAPKRGKVFQLEVDAGTKAAGVHAIITQQQQQQQQQPHSPAIAAGQSSASDELPAEEPPEPSSARASSATRARRLSLPGSPRPGAAPGRRSSSSLSSSSRGSSRSASEALTADAAASSADGAVPAPAASGSTATPPHTLSSQPGLPEGQPLPQRHVHFDDSPVRTHRYQSEEPAEEEEGEEEAGLYGGAAAAAAAAAHSACASVAGSTTTCGSAGSSGAAPERAAGSPLRVGPFVGGVAAELALRARMGGSPSKAAALAAVSMRDLLHSVASLSRAGREPTYRKTNQDSCFAYSQYCRPNQALLAALDGHGPHGHSVSSFLKRQMPLAIADALGESRAASAACCAACADPGASFTSVSSMCSTSGSGAPGSAPNSAPNSARGCCAAASADPAAALPGAFAAVDEALHKSGVNVQYSGSTAVVCMLRGRRLTTAWVGDSKAVLARQEPRGLRAIPLTRDHKPSHPEERARIQASGGRVERLVDQRGTPVGPDRVWLSSSWVPGLAMSRALGDGVAHTVGVSSEPETSVVEICAQDKFLILATDGVWEFIDPQAAVDIVSTCKDAEEACRVLVDCAWSKWLQEEEGVVDDITVVCAKLNP